MAAILFRWRHEDFASAQCVAALLSVERKWRPLVVRLNGVVSNVNDTAVTMEARDLPAHVQDGHREHHKAKNDSEGHSRPNHHQQPCNKNSVISTSSRMTPCKMMR
jgi:hypothetical protein